MDSSLESSERYWAFQHLNFGFLPFNATFQVVLVVKKSLANAGDVTDVGSITGSGRPPGGGHGNPLQYSCWEIPRTEEPGRLQSTGSQIVRPD